MYYFIKHYGMFYNLNILLHKFFNLYQINLTLSHQINKKQTCFIFKDNLLNLNLNVNKYLITPTNLKLSNINSFVKNKKLNIQIKYPFIWNLFSWFLYINFWSKNKVNKSHGFYMSLNVSFHKKRFFFLNLTRILRKWVDSYSLLINLFYFNWKLITLGSPTFSKETLALNWSCSKLNTHIWKYCFSYFIFNLNTYNMNTKLFFKKLPKLGVNLVLVADTRYHYKNIRYLAWANLHTIGLVDFSLNPWIFNFSLFVTLLDRFTISFFYSLVMMTHKYALFFKYILYRNLWINNKLKNLL